MWENLFWANNNNLRPCKVRILICLIIQNVVFAQWESLLILMFIFPSFLIVDFRISVKFLSFFCGFVCLLTECSVFAFPNVFKCTYEWILRVSSLT